MERTPGMICSFFTVPQHLEEEFNHWYNYEHAPEHMEMPGFLVARRFKSVRGYINGAQYICEYDLEAPDVVRADVYRSLSISTWTARILHHLNRWSIFPPQQSRIRRLFEQRTPVEYVPLPTGLCTGAWLDEITVGAANHADVERWLDDVYTPALAALPGVLRVRTLRTVPGAQGLPETRSDYTVWADALLASVFDTTDFLKLQAELANTRVRLGLQDHSFASYRLVWEYPQAFAPGERPVNWESVGGEWGTSYMDSIGREDSKYVLPFRP